MYSSYRKIQGRDIHIKQINSLEAEIIIDGKPITVQINRVETLFNLIKDCLKLGEGQGELQFTGNK